MIAKYHIPSPIPGGTKRPGVPITTRSGGNLLNHLSFVLALGAATAQAQTTIEVGDAGVIGDTTLPTTLGTAKLPAKGVGWTAAGGNGDTVSSLVTPTKTVVNTGAVTLTFTHRYSFEGGYDGGAVFVSVNGGIFKKVPLADFTTNGYNSTVDGTVWPKNEEVFSNQSADWSVPTLITSVATLGSLTAGDKVAVEFRGGWDANTSPAPPNWEIGTVNIVDTGATLLDANFPADGKSGVTTSTTGTGSSPWSYLQDSSRFEINATTLAADRYKPDIAGSVIDLNRADLKVVKLSGTLTAGQTYSLFDLSGGTTLTGTIGSISLPPGTWNTSNLAVNGTITLVTPPPAGFYEPFNYAGDGLNGKGGTSDYGFSAAWNASTDSKLISDPLFSKTARLGGSIGNLQGGINRFGGSRALDPTALADNGLLKDGATLWFSVDVGYDTGGNVTNSRLSIALANNTFNTGNNLYRIDDDGLVPGVGLGLTLGGSGVGNGIVKATQFRDVTQGTGSNGAGNIYGSASTSFLAAGQHSLIVGKITWGDPTLPVPTTDTIELYRPDANLNLGSVISTLTVDVDQSTFDTITWARGDKVVMDEIRFGAGSAAVMPPDVSGPQISSTKETGPLLQATFNEPVAIGTGNIRIINPSGPATLTTIAVTDTGKVTLSSNGRTLSITPTVLPVPGTVYYVEFDAGTVVDPYGNPFAGNTGPALWSFTTDSTAGVATITSPPAASPVYGTPVIPYTVSFNKFYMNDATVNPGDFVNAGTASISVGAVTRLSAASAPAVYTFNVTTSSPGTVQLRISGAINDILGNAFVTPFDDTDIYTLAAGPEPARKTITITAPVTSNATTNPNSLTFDASGSDKLVVILTGEHGNPGALGDCTAVTYDGVALTKAVDRNSVPGTGTNPATSSTDQTWNDIWYLDAPGLVHAAGTISATVGTRAVITAIGLSGTAPGVGATAVSGPASKSVTLITGASGSTVIASHGMGGDGNTANTASVNASAPLIKISTLSQGSSWDGHVTGNMLVASPGLVTPTFTGGNLNGTHTIAAEFQAAEASVAGYAAWAALNGAAADPSLDHDKDGVQNGVEYFIGGPSGNTTGFTPLAGVVNTAGTFSITWPKAAGYPGVYGTNFMVETSTAPSGGWAAEPLGGGNIVVTGTEVKYTFPGPLSGRKFARLKVTGP